MHTAFHGVDIADKLDHVLPCIGLMCSKRLHGLSTEVKSLMA